VEQAAFDLMYARYSSTAHTYFGDIEFGQMLKLFSASLPIESIKPALHLLVSNLLATDTSKYQYRAEVFTSDGRNAKADNAIDAALMWNGQVINRDPDLAQQLESTRPELRDGLEYSKPGVARGGSFGGRAGPPKPHTVDPAQEAERDAIRLAHMNPDLAISKAESLPAGPQRARTLLEVARSIAGGDPDRAMQLAAEVSTASQAGDQQTQLDLLSVKAFVAAAQHDQSGLRNLLQSGFDAAASLISGSPRPLVPGVANLVQIGIQNDPDVTLAFFQTIPPSQIKARLLLDAAEALNMHQRLPFPSRPQLKEAQAQQ
jgi:hypothetical protein